MRRKILAGLAAAVWAGGLSAQVLPQASDPFDTTKLVAFNYSENQTHPVVSRAGMFTLIEVPEGEVIQGVYLSDTEQWSFHIAGNKRHVFVKPAEGGLFNAATIITTKRTYLLAMTSNAAGVWYQKVRWVIPEAREAGYENYPAGPGGAEASAQQQDAEGGAPNFEYDIEGRASFRPLSVYDNGKITRFVLPKDAQELPALFSLNARGEPEVVNYIIQGNALQVNRLMHGALLKLGKEEVRVINRALRPEKKTWFGSTTWGN